MHKRVTTYIAAIIVCAIAAVTALARVAPDASLRALLTTAFLCSIGWAARRLTYEGTTEGARGRVNYLVFPAAAIAVANWFVPVAVGLTALALDVSRRAEWPKVLFNAAVATLASALSIVAYRAVGGQAWIEHPPGGVMPVAVLLLTSRVLNDVALAGVLVLAHGKPFLATWRAVAGRTIVDDVLVSPVVALLAYAVATWGFSLTLVAAASLIWVNRLYETNRALSRLSSELLELMVTALEARDPYTSGHSRRVSRMAMEIARVAGLPEREVARIGVAGLLHDVGKIHEKYASILQKPDRLTKDEWLLMKEHPVDGEALVAKVSELHDILPAVRHHHEKWDGSGYPDGLRGESIPLMARILTFADTIDAMTSTRPYRRGLTQAEVSAEIEKWSGQQFDPAIAAKLLASATWNTLIQPPESESTRYGLRLMPELDATHPRISMSAIGEGR